MVIGFDIGNTSTLCGIYGEADVLPAATRRYPTNKNVSAESLYAELQGFAEENAGEGLSGFVFASVVPELNGAYEKLAGFWGLKALPVSCENRLSVKLDYKDNSRLGADRIANAEAVRREYAGDCLIIDVGTAATICLLSAEGIYEGGAIAPGIETTVRALADSASNLPEIVFERPDSIIARDTVNALKSGFFYGWLSMIEGFIERIERIRGKKFRIIFTGGLSQKIAEAIERPYVWDPLLTMKGIKYIWDANTAKNIERKSTLR